MPKKLFVSMPVGYAVCQHSDCQMSKTCLHQVAYPVVLEKETYVKLINPNRCSKDAACQHYCSSNPVRFARGFVGFQKKMFPEQYEKFMFALVVHFGRNQYFKRRRGDVLLSPEEQEIIRSMLRQVGADDTMDFDVYEEMYNW